MAAKEFLAKVVDHRALTHQVFEIAFEPNEPLSFLAGQFLSVVVPGAGPNGKDLRRAYSICSNPELKDEAGKPRIVLCVQVIEGGAGSNYLNRLRPGQTLKFFAPYGAFTFKTAPDRNVVFVATGTGIAPFLSMMKSQTFIPKKFKSLSCLFGLRELRDLFYQAELKDIPGLSTVYCLSRPERELPQGMFKGRVTDWLRSQKLEIPETDFYLCGNGAMIEEVKQLLIAGGAQKSQVHQEIYFRPKEETS